MKLSALEQVPLFVGHTAGTTLEDTVRLARSLEESGFGRLWFAEHHGTGRFLSSAPDLLMMHALSATDQIHLGSGGVMAMHYGSLQMAERFSTLAALFPGRVDMGLGRAPGGDMISAHALNQGRVIDPASIDVLIAETAGLLRGTIPEGHPYAGLKVTPHPDVLPEIWLLGSSGQSAAWAGEHDLNYAYAQFFSGRQDPEVMNHYRSHLPDRPLSGHTLSAVSVSAAATHAEAVEQALPAAHFRSALRMGREVEFRDPSLMPEDEKAELRRYLEADTSMVIGTFDEVAQRLRAFATNHGVEELMLISYIADVEQKATQYRELAVRLLD